MNIEKVPNDKIIDGMKKSFSNAESLLNDAYFLQSNKKWSRAYTLSQLAIEELGKIPMLFELLINRINDYPIDYENLNSSFKNHPEKTKSSINSEIAFMKLYKEHSGAKWVDEYVKKKEEQLANVDELNRMKNESLYVSVINNDFQSPEDIITEEKFNSIYGTAIIQKTFFKNLVDASEKNINEIARLIKEDKSNKK